MRGQRSKTVVVEAGRLKVHPVAQRLVHSAKLKRMIDNLDLDAIGTMHIVDYSIDGQSGPWVIDGQHRKLALDHHAFGDWKVTCVLHQQVDNDERACDLFLKLNDRTAIRPFDKFANEVVAADPVAVGAKDVAEAAGLEVNRQAGEGHVACVDTLKRVYALDDGETLRETLSVAIEAWGRTAGAVEGKIVEGLALVVGSVNGGLDRPVLVKKLAKYPGGAAGLIGDAKGLYRIRHANMSRCVAEAVVEAYNNGRRAENRIPLP